MTIRGLLTIYELGVRAGTYAENVRALDRRYKKLLKRGIVGDSRLRIATTGHTDIVDIFETHELFPYYAPPTGETLTFRRPVGACCLSSTSSGTPRFELVSVGKVLGADELRPIVGVHYFKLSSLVKALAPTSRVLHGEVNLAGIITEALTRPETSLWESLAHIEAAAVGAAPTSPPARICLLVGLDQVEVVALIRTSRLEAVAAFVEAMRRVPVSQVLPGASSTWGRFRTEIERSPIFASSTSILGMALDGSGARVVRHADPEGLAAHRARVLFRTRYPPGTRGLQRDSLERASGLFGVPDVAPRPDTVAFGLFGPFEVAPRAFAPITQRTLADCIEHITGLRPLTEFPSEFVGVGESSTTLEVALGEHKVDDADATILARFAGALRAEKRDLLGEDSPRSWVRAWKERADDLMIEYPVTNAGVNLLTTVAGFLDGDLDGFLDLIGRVPALWADQGLRYFEIEQLLRTLNAMVDARVRREAPTHPPTTPLAFESYAGYSTAHNAFLAYLHALSTLYDVSEPLVEEPFGTLPMLRRLGSNTHATNVSPIGIHHPLFWVHAHELGHLREAARRAASPADDPLALILEAMRSCRKFARLPELIGDTLLEVDADLYLWHALSGPGEGVEAHARRFWFVVGPVYIAEMQPHCRPEPPETHLRLVDRCLRRCLRILVLSITTESEEADIARDIADGLAALANVPVQARSAALRRALSRVETFRDDMEIAEIIDGEVFRRLAESLAELSHQMAGWVRGAKHRQPCPGRAPDAEAMRMLHVGYTDAVLGLLGSPGDRPWLPFINGHEVDEPHDVALSRRGGPFFAERLKQPGGVRDRYFSLTFELLLRMEELGRMHRYEPLSDILCSSALSSESA